MHLPTGHTSQDSRVFKPELLVAGLPGFVLEFTLQIALELGIA
jgi:hypothetical protein